VRKARAEVAAYADCTESQMMAMFGWTDPKMPAHYIAQANRGEARHERHGQNRGVRSEPVSRRIDAVARCQQGLNVRREQSSNFA
jgi:hypothetical protein